MARVVMYSTRTCPHCRMAERILQRRAVAVEYVHVDAQPELRIEMKRITGRTSVPQIFINGQHVGGHLELAELDRNGKLDALLQVPAA